MRRGTDRPTSVSLVLGKYKTSSVTTARAAFLSLLLAANAAPTRAFECQDVSLTFEPFTSDPDFHPSGTGEFHFSIPPVGGEVTTSVVVHSRLTGNKDNCASTMQCDVENTLRVKRGPQGLAFTHSWPAHHCPMVLVCDGHESHVDMPGDAYSQSFKLGEQDGATTQVVRPPPMKSGMRYTVHLRPTLPGLTDALHDCPVSDDLLTRATAAADGHPPTIECHEGVGQTTHEENKIELQYDRSRCRMISELIQELSNAAERAAITKVQAAAKSGDLDRESYIQQLEMIEFTGVRLRVRAVEECGKQWACLSGDRASWQTTTNFQQYYDGLKAHNPEHPAGYGKDWDLNYKPAYDAKHH